MFNLMTVTTMPLRTTVSLYQTSGLFIKISLPAVYFHVACLILPSLVTREAAVCPVLDRESLSKES